MGAGRDVRLRLSFQGFADGKGTIRDHWRFREGPLVIRDEVCYQARDLIGNCPRTRPKVVSMSMG